MEPQAKPEQEAGQATSVNEYGEWEGLPPSAAAPEPAPAESEPAAEETGTRYASLEEAAKAAEAAGVTNAVMMGLDMARDGNLMEDMLGLNSGSTPSGKLSSKQRTAKQKSKLQKSLRRDATQSAQAMAKINAAARQQTRVLLTAPRACSTLPNYTHRTVARVPARDCVNLPADLCPCPVPRMQRCRTCARLTLTISRG